MRVERSFAFLDLCGFTRFTDLHGDGEAVIALTQFRNSVREIASIYAVRVDKWLGDGVMLVSPTRRRLVEANLAIMERVEASGLVLPLRGGMAVGPVLLLEGDDYVGSAVNLASRLCAKAAPGELLATDELTSDVPKSAEVISVGALDVSGFAQSVEVVRIQARTQIDLAAAG
ncbi:MAG: hypothetical protein CK520_05015 [Actinobacteria bacterium]|nr:adenylate/guanylate cyclase domain-containing protein [Acidimicrobiia bacterium]PHX59341.1 MAG: hypothetical protein CK520_05015 [Actinomycetota bacterium]